MPIEPPKPKILYIDDEEINLSNFRQTFEEVYFLHTASSAAQGMQILEDQGEMALVITDQRMPGITGIELLTQISKKFPDTVRIILTAYTDAHEIIDAINKGQVFRYIVKPWDERELALSMRNAVKIYDLTKKNAQLMKELEEKNISLARMNADLEERVIARTRELHETNMQLKRNNDQLIIAHMKEQEMTTELASLNQILSERLGELNRAINSIEDLQKLLPICAYCKKIRDDRDYWHDLQQYMEKYSDYTFSHSICPDCYDEHAEELWKEKGKKKGDSVDR